MAGLTGGGGGGGGADYVQDSAPGGADVGETWVDTSATPPREKVWTGSEWIAQADSADRATNADSADSVAWSNVSGNPSNTQSAGMAGGYNGLYTVTGSNQDSAEYTVVSPELEGGVISDGVKIAPSYQYGYVSIIEVRVYDTNGNRIFRTTLNHGEGNTSPIECTHQEAQIGTVEVDCSASSHDKTTIDVTPHVVTLPTHSHSL